MPPKMMVDAFYNGGYVHIWAVVYNILGSVLVFMAQIKLCWASLMGQLH